MKDKNLTDVLSTVDKHADKDLIANLRSRLSACESLTRQFSESRGGQLELARTVAEAVKAVEPYGKFYTPPKNRPSSPISAVLHLSDLHIGEIIRPQETEGFGAFNFSIASARLEKLVEKVIEWVEFHRHQFVIPKLYIVGNGDYISGDIHQELLVTNEFPLPEQTAKAGIAVGELIRRAAGHFDEVEFVGVGADNHGRLQKKPQAKQKTSNNMSFLVHAIAQSYLSGHKNVRFEFAEGIKLRKEISNHRFLIEHGDAVKAVMGIPYYGIERMSGREAKRRMNSGKEFDYHMLGHWHVPGIVSGNVLMNGSLSGTTEFDHSFGRHALPSQTSFMVHPKFGVFDWVSWRFKIEEEETDGRRKK